MNTPVNKSLAAMAVSFFAYLFTLHVLKPSWVMTTKLDGTRALRRDKASLYSALFSIITAIIVFVISVAKSDAKLEMAPY